MSSTEAMMQAHDALDVGVYLVEVFLHGKFQQHGIFSTVDKAKDWMVRLPPEYACVVAPFVLDEPDYGNVAKEDMQ